MVAHMAHALRNAGRFGSTQLQNGAQSNQQDGGALPERHADSKALGGVEKVASISGEGLFQASFVAGAAGWLFRNSVGRFNKNWGANVGRYTVAPFEALDATSLKQLVKTPNVLKANYFARAAEYVGEHGGSAAAELAAKAEALGGAQLAKANWQGIGKIGNYLMHRGAFSTLMAGGLALGSGVVLFKSGKEARDDLVDIKEIAKDLGHEITADQFFRHPEGLPPMIRDMRDNLIDHLKTNVASAGGKVIGNAAFAAMGGPLAQHAGGMFGLPMAGMMGGMMVESAAHEFAPSQDFVHNYLQVKDLQAAGQPVSPELYAGLMAASSAEVRKMPDSEQTQLMAQQYAGEQISPAALVREVYAHEPFVARAKAVYDQLQAEQKSEAPEADVADVTPEHANINATPHKTSLGHAAHMGKVGVESAVELGARL